MRVFLQRIAPALCLLVLSAAFSFAQAPISCPPPNGKAAPASCRLNLSFKNLCKDPKSQAIAPCAANAEPYIAQCLFAYPDGKLYPVKNYQCDYMHAEVKNLIETFNNLPSLWAQLAFVNGLQSDADGAYQKYENDSSSLLKEKIPDNLSLAQNNKLLGNSGSRILRVCGPFLWQKRLEPSYIIETVGAWPHSWDPYTSRFTKVSNALRSRIKQQQDQAIAQANVKIKKLYASAQAMRSGSAMSASASRAYFDGGAGAGTSAASAANVRGQAAKGLPTAPPVAGVHQRPIAVPDLINVKDAGYANYFANGTAAGLARLKDRVKIAAWHLGGIAQTIGRPYQDMRYAIWQNGSTCGIASAYEALRAHGHLVGMPQMTRQAARNGYYVEYVMKAGKGLYSSGMEDDGVSKLLTSHGLRNWTISNPSQNQLLASIYGGGGAIVSVHPREFWNDPTESESDEHYVYITGAEVGGNGKVYGYYVNDTGTGEGARFISTADFKKAWDNGSMISLVPPTSVRKPGAYPIETGILTNPFFAETDKRGFGIKWAVRELEKEPVAAA